MTDQTTPMKQEEWVKEFDIKFNHFNGEYLGTDGNGKQIDDEICDKQYDLEDVKAFISQLLLQKEQEVRDKIKAIDLNEEGRHMTIGELLGDLIDSLK